MQLLCEDYHSGGIQNECWGIKLMQEENMKVQEKLMHYEICLQNESPQWLCMQW